MDKQILDLLTEMSKEMKSMKSDIHSLKSEMHNRFDTIEAKLEGVGGQFELTNESRINEVDFIADKVNKLEKDLYILKNKSSN
ncbi:hypothetical protein [Virgibacillus dokdonensis]|uniref:Uncharacterized protein n=1 Tax=Oceanobacillus halophilus TaxID=930130 RepID=A0A495A1D1_9BACI|nr:hypothetical protein [Virgibacillus dokdonensis]RKQ32536.1 hypothetical protein D8M06_12820 [Oceanobacillus halophilus]